MAFSMRCDWSSGLFRRSRFIRRRGEALAWAVKESSICWSIIISLVCFIVVAEQAQGVDNGHSHKVTTPSESIRKLADNGKDK